MEALKTHQSFAPTRKPWFADRGFSFPAVSGGVKPLDSGGERRFLVVAGSLDLRGMVVSSLARAA
jgi:hypothetical protein